MKQNKKEFVPDPRNLGGRKQLIDHMYNHHDALLQMKPILKIEQPRKHVDHKLGRKPGLK